MTSAARVSDSRPGNPISDTAPCIGCGLCCDGTIHDKAEALPEEKERLTEAGLHYFIEGNNHWFSHPCRFSKAGLCTIYHQERFSVCRTFRCKLLTAYQAGEVSKETALAKVQQALALRAAVTDVAPTAREWKVRRPLLDELASTKRDPRLLLAISALENYLDTWFRGPAEIGAMERKPVTGDVTPNS
jgi:Fe-S-cluster containining protein